MKTYNKWASQKSSIKKRVALLIFGALVFPLLIPIILIKIVPKLDNIMGIGSYDFGNINIVIGLILIITGGIIAFWTIYLQMHLASGTPFPMVPTKNLIISGPFSVCRNPMTLGTILMYFGISVMIGSLASIICFAIFAILLFIYIKGIEEKELAERFGTKYTQYKSNVPFIIPNVFLKAKI